MSVEFFVYAHREEVMHWWVIGFGSDVGIFHVLVCRSSLLTSRVLTPMRSLLRKVVADLVASTLEIALPRLVTHVWKGMTTTVKWACSLGAEIAIREHD